MTAFAFVFARGGSKGLPGKNVKRLAGKPLINHSIEIALKSSLFKFVFVSTDDEIIAKEAKSAGAIIIKRPIELASDDCPEWLAWQHGIEWARENYGDFSEFVSLPATSPLRAINDIARALEKLKNHDSDICIAVTRSNRNPYFNMVKLNDEGMLELAVNTCETKIFRRQDAPEIFDITTVVYASSPSFIMNNSSIFDGKVTAIEVPKERAIDIDDEFDFLLAQTILNEKLNAEK